MLCKSYANPDFGIDELLIPPQVILGPQAVGPPLLLSGSFHLTTINETFLSSNA